MTYAEAVELIVNLLELEDKRCQLTDEALAVLRGMAEENERPKNPHINEMVRWLDEFMPLKGGVLSEVITTLRDYKRTKAESADIREKWKRLKAIPDTERDKENTALKAEVERLTAQNESGFAASLAPLKSRAEKAEAELDAARKKAVTLSCPECGEQIEQLTCPACKNVFAVEPEEGK